MISYTKQHKKRKQIIHKCLVYMRLAILHIPKIRRCLTINETLPAPCPASGNSLRDLHRKPRVRTKSQQHLCPPFALPVQVKDQWWLYNKSGQPAVISKITIQYHNTFHNPEFNNRSQLSNPLISPYICISIYHNHRLNRIVPVETYPWESSRIQLPPRRQIRTSSSQELTGSNCPRRDRSSKLQEPLTEPQLPVSKSDISPIG